MDYTFDYADLNFPPELRDKIALQSNYKDLINLCKTSGGVFREICGSNGFWKQKTYYDFGDLYDIEPVLYNIRDLYEDFQEDWWETYQHYRSVFSKEFISALRADPLDANLIFNMIDVIDERGFLIVGETDERGSNALTVASIEGYTDIVQFLLEEEGANPNLADEDRDTALVIASRNGHADTTKMLLKNGADPNLLSSNRWRPLTGASSLGRTDIVEILLNAGANPNLYDGGEVRWTALMWASQEGSKAIVEKLLENGAIIDLKDGQEHTALMIASYNDQKAIVEKLLENEADPNLTDGEGKTALQFAIEQGHTDIVDILEPVTES